MILAIGTDIVKVSRFKNWHTKSIKQLKKIFSDKEIEYCLQNSKTSTQRFAARFATKEAFYKAYSHYDATHTLSLIQLCKLVEVVHNQASIPILILNKQLKQENTVFHVSISHEKEYAMSIVIIYTLS